MPFASAGNSPSIYEHRTMQDTPAQEADDWAFAWTKRLALLFLFAFLCPLVKSSLFFDKTILVWPWTFLFSAGDFETAAALAPGDPNGSWALWALLPFFAWLAILLLRRTESAGARAWGLIVTGAVALAAMLFFFAEEQLVYGLLFLAPDIHLQLFILALLGGAGLVAIGNRLRKSFSLHPLPRVVAIAGALLTTSAMLVPLGTATSAFGALFDGASWRREWPFQIAFLMFIALAGLGTTAALKRCASEAMQAAQSLIFRVLCVWLPLSYGIVRQGGGGDGFETFMLEGGGGSLTVVVALLKACAFYYAAALAVAVGVTTLLQRRLWSAVESGAACETDPNPAAADSGWTSRRRLGVAGGAFALLLAGGFFAMNYFEDGKGVAAKRASFDEVWAFSVDGPLLTTPGFSDGRIFVGGVDERLHAVAIADGSEAWSFAAGGSISSDPLVEGGVVYFGSRDGHLYALRESDGAKLWSFRTGAPIESAPVVSSGLLCCGTRVGSEGKVFGLDLESGEKLWEVQVEGSLINEPVSSDSVIYFVEGRIAGGVLHAVHAGSGETLFSFDVSHRILTSPALGDGLVYFGCQDGTLYAIDAAADRVRWQFETGYAIHGSPLVHDQAVYFGNDDGNLIALDAATGEEQWRVSVGGPVYSAPAFAGDNLVVCDWAGNGWIIDLASRTVQSTFPIGFGQDASPICADGVLYNAETSGRLRALRFD